MPSDQPPSPTPTRPVGRPLTEIRRDEPAAFVALAGDQEDAAPLRAMGLRPNCRVVLRRIGEPCIVEVGGCSGCVRRIGIARTLAARILVADQLANQSAGQSANQLGKVALPLTQPEPCATPSACVDPSGCQHPDSPTRGSGDEHAH